MNEVNTYASPDFDDWEKLKNIEFETSSDGRSYAPEGSGIEEVSRFHLPFVNELGGIALKSGE